MKICYSDSREENHRYAFVFTAFSEYIRCAVLLELLADGTSGR
jgi:hypothetical protein